MDILYRQGRATAGEVMESLSGEPTYSTVRTQLRVLEEKGHVRHEEHGLKYVYFPAVPRTAARKSALRHLVDTFFEGSAEARRCRAARRRRRAIDGRGARAHQRDGETGRNRQGRRCGQTRQGGQGRKGGREMTLLLNTSILNTSIKVTLIVLVALAASALLRRRSAAVRHFVLAAALACAAATPALRLVAPAWQATAGAWLTESRLQLIDRPLARVRRDRPPARCGRSRGQSPGVLRAAVIARWLTVVWAGGAAASLFVLLVGLGRLAWLASKSRSASPTGRGRVSRLNSRATYRTTPAARAAPERSDHAARHVGIRPAEGRCMPIRRRGLARGPHPHRAWLTSSRTSGAATGSCSWWRKSSGLSTGSTRSCGSACRRLRLESEQACDDAVLEMGVEGVGVRDRAHRPGQSVQVSAGCFFPPPPSPVRQASKGEFAPC